MTVEIKKLSTVKNRKGFKRSGIIPYMNDPNGKDRYFLLGVFNELKENSNRTELTDFGGTVNNRECETPVGASIREFIEETDQNVIVPIPSRMNQSVTVTNGVMSVTFYQLPRDKYKELRDNFKSNKEIRDFRTVSSDILISKIKDANNLNNGEFSLYLPLHALLYQVANDIENELTNNELHMKEFNKFKTIK